MKIDDAKIIEHIQIGEGVYKMTLATCIAEKVQCGQFVEVEVPGYFLRRPISVCEVLENNRIVLVYKVVGDGTNVLSSLPVATNVNIFGPLGTGFPIRENSVLLIGGGVGVPPLLETAKQYKKLNQRVVAVLGFNTTKDVILETEFKALGCETFVATMDGSYGTKGTVLDAIADNQIDLQYVLSCGPLPMLKAVSNKYKNGYISLEARMACGIGACMGCVVKDIHENSLRVCKDGPVFEIGKVVL